MIAAIDLDQLAVALASQTGLVEATALLTRQPEPILDHPLAQSLARHLDSILREKHLRRQAWTKV